MGDFGSDTGFHGNSLAKGTLSYDRANKVYATSTYGVERNMNPGEIFQPSSIDDICFVVKRAAAANKHIAIRTGGHQYSGASSTDPSGIQLDLKPTFRRPNIDLHLEDGSDGKKYLRTSVSWTLSEIFDFLQDNGVFMPTGQCSTVCLGGHIQTGGYGMLARSFGLLGDYVRELDIVDYRGQVVKLTKETHPEHFNAFLGGSPGNLGVLTHAKIEVQQDTNHKNSKGLWMGFFYSEETLTALLDILVKRGQDPNLPRGYDMTVNISSRSSNLLDIFPGTEDELRKLLPNLADDKNAFANVRKFKYAMIVVYAQWVDLPGEAPFNKSFFDEIKAVPNGPLPPIKKEASDNTPMSQIAAMWLFASPREFDYPYVKRTNSTTSLRLSETKWSTWFAGRVNEIIKNKDNGLWVSSQLQVYGGKASMFQRNATNGTSYCFRDATYGGTWDCFFDHTRTGTKKAAEAWQLENDKGRSTYFSETDRRVLWGSYGDWDMKKVWKYYYEEDTYKKVQKARGHNDPYGTFTANPFCVEAKGCMCTHFHKHK